MNNRQQESEQSLSPNELEEVLGVKGIRPEHVLVVNKLANAWKLQADIGGLNQDTVNSILHATSVRATALMPSRSLRDSDTEQFDVLSGLSQLARAEEAVIQWAYKDKFTIDGAASDIPKQITSEK